MLKIALCDDLPAHSAHLAELLKGESAAAPEVAVFSRGEDLLSAMERDKFHVYFLDIELGTESGVRLANAINARQPDAQIIFVTANVANAVDIDEAEHAYFLRKPVDPVKLHSALSKAERLLQERTDRRILVPLRGTGEALLAPGDILYCERVKRTTVLYTAGDPLFTSMNLEALEQALPRLLFARPHNSYLVNLSRVSKIERASVLMDNGVSLSISNFRRAGFREALGAFVTGYGA